MIKKQTINEIYLSNGIEIQQYVFYCTASNTTLGGVLEAIDTQGFAINVYSTTSIEALVLQLPHFIDDTMHIYYDAIQEEDDKYNGLSPSEYEHFVNWNKSKEEEEEEDTAAKGHDPYHADRAACLTGLDEGVVLL